MHSEKVTLGKFGEEKAVKYLSSNGYKILCRNFRCKIGEIDIVARDTAKKNLVIFFEVKTRKNCDFGLPCESITAAKLQKIKKIIAVYALVKKCKHCDLRIDAIEVLVMQDRVYIRHLENVD